MPDLLLELLSEEIPARMQARAADDLRRLVTDALAEAGLPGAGARAFATPRRLALAVQGLAARSPLRREERKGPRVDAPEAALAGFLRSAGVPREALVQRDEKKGAVWMAVIDHPGRPAEQIVAEVVERVIRTFPWPKSMRWGAGSLRWVRPLQSILCLLTDETGARVVPLAVDGLVAGDVTRGHRFMAPAVFSVTGFEDYAAKLKRARVMLDPEERAAVIRTEAANIAFAQGLEVVEDAALLAEVAGLVEWPVVLSGPIGEEFLGLPPEVLQTSMREHQKFFSLRDPGTGRITRFVTVANRETADAGATILAGNRKVLAARLNDAKFFWENDLRKVAQVGLEGMAEGLAQVTFHNKLGSQKDRISRIAALAREIAPLVGADPDQAALAAGIVKADLRSEMVGEFPELQGVMGVYYARAQGLPEDVARACREHYQPLGPSDTVPSSPVSVAVALADKIDTLTGFWIINQKPTGSKDPFALRRACLGVFRLLSENSLRASLLGLLRFALETYHKGWSAVCVQARWFQWDKPYDSFRVGGRFEISTGWVREIDDANHAVEYIRDVALRSTAKDDVMEALDDVLEAFCGPFPWALTVSHCLPDLLAFLHDRLKVHLREQGIPHDVIDAVLHMPGNDDLTLLVKRAEALAAFLKTDDGENLVQGFKRANNILTQAEAQDGVEYSFGPDPKLAATPEETALFAALDAAEAAIAPAMASEDFAAAMTAMAALRGPVDAFFEAVQVNTDNAILRRNRLNLLHRIRATCAQVADLTRLQG